MKNKIKALAFACSSLLFLSACAGATATISDGQDVLFTVGNQDVTREDEYDLIKMTNGTNMTVELIRQAIMDEEIGRGDDIMQQAEEQYETNASNSSDFESSLQAAGYKDKDDYIDKVIVPTIQQDKLMDKYFTDNKKAIRKEYKPTIAKLLMCDNKNDADNALQALKDGTDPQAVWDQYASDTAAYGNEEIVVSTALKDTIPTYVINTLYAADDTGVIDEVMTADDNSSDGYYYVGILISKDYDENLERIQTDLTSRQGDTLNNECLVYYMKKHNFEVHDQDIFDSLRTSNPDYLIDYPELSQDQDKN